MIENFFGMKYCRVGFEKCCFNCGHDCEMLAVTTNVSVDDMSKLLHSISTSGHNYRDKII